MFDPNLNSLVFFFGIFWATILSTVPDYQLFVVGKSHCRWVIGITVLNLFPLVLLLGLSLMFSVIPEQAGIVKPICAAIASLSVFSTFYFLRAILAAYLKRLKYSKKEMEHLSEKFGLTAKKKVWSSARIGLQYLFGWPFLASFIGVFFGS
jgi:hypothetical protein